MSLKLFKNSELSNLLKGFLFFLKQTEMDFADSARASATASEALGALSKSLTRLEPDVAHAREAREQISELLRWKEETSRELALLKSHVAQLQAAVAHPRGTGGSGSAPATGRSNGDANPSTRAAAPDSDYVGGGGPAAGSKWLHDSILAPPHRPPQPTWRRRPPLCTPERGRDMVGPCAVPGSPPLATKTRFKSQ